MKQQCKCDLVQCIGAGLCLTVLVLPSAAADDWPVVRGDSQGSGVARSAISDSLDVLWTYHAGGDAGFEATAVVAEGVVYLGDDGGTFHAVRLADGTAVWTADFDESSFLAGAAFDQQRLYVGDAGGVVRCLSAIDGTEVWKNEDLTAEVYAGPIVRQQDVLVTSESGTLICLDANSGVSRWTFTIDAPLRCTPTIVDGQVLLAGCDSKLHLVDAASGKETTTVAIDAPTGATAAAHGQRVYFGTEGGTFYAMKVKRRDGQAPTVDWTYRDPERGQPIRSAAAVNDLLVVYGGQSRAIYGLDPAVGELKWKLSTRSRVDSSPVIAGERVVAAAERGVLYVLDAATGAEQWQFDAGGSFTASPIVVDGRILLGNTDGTLHCFGTKAD